MKNLRYAITTGRSRVPGLLEKAQAWGAALEAPVIIRQRNQRLEALLEQQNLEALVVATAGGPQVITAQGKFTYHPSMAVLRLQQLKENKVDYLVEALGLRLGLKVLDCTLGLAADAAIASYVVGSEGRVVGLEASRLLHFLVSQGLRTYVAEDKDLALAMKRITALNIRAEDYLPTVAVDQYDVIYFDPMFRKPVQGSSGMDGMRPFTYEEPLSLEAVKLAAKLAQRVVIKERSEEILASYGCREFVGGKYSRIKYGIIRR